MAAAPRPTIRIIFDRKKQSSENNPALIQIEVYFRGKKKYFSSYRMYIPLNPYPLKSTDILAIDGNLANMTLEFGVGTRLK